MSVDLVREKSSPRIESDSDEEPAEEDIQSAAVPRGKPKSGRIGKMVNQRFSSMNKVKPLRTSWAVKMKAKSDRKHTVALHKEMKDAHKKEKQDARTRATERKKREEENARKAEIVQPIRNTGKIKRMKKKQLRQIEKR